MKVFASALILLLPAWAAESANEIVKRSLDRDRRNLDRAKDYAYERTTIERDLDDRGNVQHTTSEKRDVIILYGRPIGRIVEKDGKALSGKDREREEARFNRVAEKRRRETSDENTKERRAYEKNLAAQRKFEQEIPEAFDFKLLRKEQIGNRDVYLIQADPKRGFKPRDFRAGILTRMRGKLWIDAVDYNWVKVEAETTGTISFGWLLARIGPGTQIHVEQRRVNDELWLPAHVALKLDARLAVFKKMRRTVEVEFSNYRKFQTDTKIVIPGEK